MTCVVHVGYWTSLILFLRYDWAVKQAARNGIKPPSHLNPPLRWNATTRCHGSPARSITKIGKTTRSLPSRLEKWQPRQDLNLKIAGLQANRVVFFATGLQTVVWTLCPGSPRTRIQFYAAQVNRPQRPVIEFGLNRFSFGPNGKITPIRPEQTEKPSLQRLFRFPAPVQIPSTDRSGRP